MILQIILCIVLVAISLWGLTNAHRWSDTHNGQSHLGWSFIYVIPFVLLGRQLDALFNLTHQYGNWWGPTAACACAFLLMFTTSRFLKNTLQPTRLTD
jgi:hypothetical protein